MTPLFLHCSVPTHNRQLVRETETPVQVPTLTDTNDTLDPLPCICSVPPGVHSHRTTAHYKCTEAQRSPCGRQQKASIAVYSPLLKQPRNHHSFTLHAAASPDLLPLLLCVLWNAIYQPFPARFYFCSAPAADRNKTKGWVRFILATVLIARD